MCIFTKFLLLCFLISLPAHAGYLDHTFNHDQLTYQNWQDRADHAKQTIKIAGYCNQQEMRVEDFRVKSGSYIYRLSIDQGGYLPQAVVFREVRRMIEVAYVAFERIKLIRYSIREWADPKTECRSAADAAIRRIAIIRDKFPPMQ